MRYRTTSFDKNRWATIQSIAKKGYKNILALEVLFLLAHTQIYRNVVEML